jgi:hypothetical protein
LIEQGFYLSQIGHVDLDDRGGFAQLISQCGKPVAPAGHQNDVDAFGGQQACSSLPDPTRCTRDDGNFAGEVLHFHDSSLT